MASEYVPIFFDWVEVTGELTAQEKGRLIDAIVLYAQGGDWQEQIKGNERYLFPAFKKQIDRARETSGKRASAGYIGGKQKQTEANVSKCKQTEANASKNAKEYNNNNNNNNDKEYKNEVKGDEVPPTPQKAPRRFTPPSLEDVAAYCQKRGNGVSPQRFVDFYTAKGWRVGNQQMRDWRAAVRTWETRENYDALRPPDRGKTVGAQRYQQRQYTEDELAEVGVDLLREAQNERRRTT